MSNLTQEEFLILSQNTNAREQTSNVPDNSIQENKKIITYCTDISVLINVTLKKKEMLADLTLEGMML